MNINEPQAAYSLFHKKFHDSYTQSFPLKTFTLNYRNRKPWLSIGLKKSIKKKNDLYVKHKRYPTRIMEFTYKQYKKNLDKILYKAEKDHYEKLFQSHKSNMRKS